MPRTCEMLPRRAREAGFSLIEMLVTLAVMALLTVGILGVFDFNNKLARVQTQVADMQQSLRVAQYDMVRQVRMAGRGGVPALRSVELRNNVGETGPQETILIGQASPAVLVGSDVITIRGAFNSPIYQLDFQRAGEFGVDQAAGTGWVIVRDPAPSGLPHDMEPIREMLGEGGDPPTKEAMLLVSPRSDDLIAVVEFDPTNSNIVTVDTAMGPVTTAMLRFRFRGGDNADQFSALAPGGGPGNPFPLPTAMSLAILEEYRFYVRDFRPPAGAAGSPIAPKLSIARVFPGTERAYRNDAANLQLDLADNILDLQAALGVDRDGDGEVEEAAAKVDNEWLYDDPADAPFAGRRAYVRINTIARTDRPDRDYQTPRLEPLEDRIYKTTAGDLNDPATPERYYRRRLLQTVVDMRNVG